MEPGTKIVVEERSRRVVDDHEYELVCIHWNATSGVSWDVYDDGELLTEAESFDEEPTDDEIRALLEREPPCTDPRPDPRTHPDYWCE